jgi:hypothetical protein
VGLVIRYNILLNGERLDPFIAGFLCLLFFGSSLSRWIAVEDASEEELKRALKEIDGSSPGPNEPKKKKRLLITIILGIVTVVLVAFLYLSLHIEGRYKIGVKLGFVTADTSLHEASGRRQKDTVEHLVNSGCDVNGKDRWGQTPLLIAAGSGNTNVAEFLIAKGAVSVHPITSNFEKSPFY